MNRATSARIAKALLFFAGLVLVVEALLFAWTMVQVLNGFEKQSQERREATAELIANQEQRSRELQKDLAKKAQKDRTELRRSLREVLRQLGLDPSRIPPPNESEPEEREQSEPPERREPEPRPSSSPTRSPKPSPSPSRTCLARVGPICVEEP